MGGELRTEWAYSSQVHCRPRIEALADGFMSALRSILIACGRPGAEALTPSDFPLADLDDDKLGRISLLLSKADSASSGLSAGLSQ
jgi:non-ribosomal peptide synthase protein (TIGR01720 family)